MRERVSAVAALFPSDVKKNGELLNAAGEQTALAVQTTNLDRVDAASQVRFCRTINIGILSRFTRIRLLDLPYR